MMKTSRPLLTCLLLACLALTLPAQAQSVDEIPGIAAKIDVTPKPLKTKAPRYPEKLRAQGITGAVVVLLVVDEQGKVLAAEAAKATREEFREPAVSAVREWTFVPAKADGKAVRARVSIPVTFSLEG